MISTDSLLTIYWVLLTDWPTFYSRLLTLFWLYTDFFWSLRTLYWLSTDFLLASTDFMLTFYWLYCHSTHFSSASSDFPLTSSYFLITFWRIWTRIWENLRSRSQDSQTSLQRVFVSRVWLELLWRINLVLSDHRLWSTAKLKCSSCPKIRFVQHQKLAYQQKKVINLAITAERIKNDFKWFLRYRYDQFKDN